MFQLKTFKWLDSKRASLLIQKTWFVEVFQKQQLYLTSASAKLLTILNKNNLSTSSLFLPSYTIRATMFEKLF